MFWFSLACLSLIATSYASPLSRRAEGISVEIVPAATSVSSIADLKFTANIKNTGLEAVRILNYGTILDSQLPTKSFVVTKDGAAVAFTGVKVSVSLTDADDSAYTVINAGETVSVTHEVAALYDFANAGAGTFSFEPITDFVFAGTAVEAVSPATFSKAQAVSNVVQVEITGDLKKRELKALEGRARNICTNTSRASFITSSYNEAKTLANRGISYISSRGTSDSVYRAYWGANTASRITAVLQAVASESSSSRTLSCVDSYGACSGGVIAYTVVASTNIYYCNIFFNEVATANLCSGTTVASRNVRGGTTLHELTHAVANTDDVTYGCAADQRLSDANKYRNADNYNCFTTQVYQNTGC